MTRTTDAAILAHITALVAEEERLHTGGDKDKAQDRLAAIGVELDQYWDLLRRRRALREFGKNPDDAELQPASIVEKYQG